MFSNTCGSDNTDTGFKALFYMDVAADNTAVGSQALINAKLIYNQSDETFYSPEGNTALESHALDNNTGGYYNTELGFNADIATSLQHNSVAIGAFANAAASDIVQVGNTSITSIRGQVGWSTFSDGRYKKNIKKDVQGLVFINNLEPITYTVDINKLNDYYDKNKKRDSSYEKMKIYMKKSSDKTATIVYNGFIAQDVEKAAAKLNYILVVLINLKTKMVCMVYVMQIL